MVVQSKTRPAQVYTAHITCVVHIRYAFTRCKFKFAPHCWFWCLGNTLHTPTSLGNIFAAAGRNTASQRVGMHAVMRATTDSNVYDTINNVFKCVYVCSHTHIYVYVCMCACVHVCMCVCMCACVHVCSQVCRCEGGGDGCWCISMCLMIDYGIHCV